MHREREKKEKERERCICMCIYIYIYIMYNAKARQDKAPHSCDLGIGKAKNAEGRLPARR